MKRLLLGASLAALLAGSAFSQSGQPSQWNYFFDNNGNGTAAYPGNVQVSGSLTLPNSTGLAAGTGTFSQSLSVAGISIFPHGGLVGIQTFCSSGCTSTGGTYVPDTGTTQFIAVVIGGGGGSGGCAATTSGQYCMSQAGDSGPIGVVLWNGSLSGITVTAGTAGGGGSATPGNGGSGGTSSLTGMISCAGGQGGTSGAATAFSSITAIAPASSTATCNFTGGTEIYGIGSAFGSSGIVFSAALLLPSTGGSVPGYGQGGYSLPVTTTTTGQNGLGYGAGGSAAANAASQAATAGKSGAKGLVIIYEYS